jgi:hypothetical protein
LKAHPELFVQEPTGLGLSLVWRLGVGSPVAVELIEDEEPHQDAAVADERRRLEIEKALLE